MYLRNRNISRAWKEVSKGSKWLEEVFKPAGLLEGKGIVLTLGLPEADSETRAPVGGDPKKHQLGECDTKKGRQKIKQGVLVKLPLWATEASPASRELGDSVEQASWELCTHGVSVFIC